MPVHHLKLVYLPCTGGSSTAPKPAPSLAARPATVFCISAHSESLGETSFSATSYTYSLPSLPPSPTLRDKGVRSHASLFSARSDTEVETMGIWAALACDNWFPPKLMARIGSPGG